MTATATMPNNLKAEAKRPGMSDHERRAGPPRRGPPVEEGKPLGPGQVYIGRATRFGPTVWGNPYKVAEDRTAAQCVDLFKAELYRERGIQDRLRTLEGKALRCHCPPDMPCHADAIIEVYKVLLPEVSGSLVHLESPPSERDANQVAHVGGPS